MLGDRVPSVEINMVLAGQIATNEVLLESDDGQDAEDAVAAEEHVKRPAITGEISAPHLALKLF